QTPTTTTAVNTESPFVPIPSQNESVIIRHPELSNGTDVITNPAPAPAPAPSPLPPILVGPAASWILGIVKRVRDMVQSGVLDINQIIIFGIEFVNQVKVIVSDPKLVWDHVLGLIQAIEVTLRENDITAEQIHDVSTVLQNALSVVAGYFAGVPGLPIGCWLGQLVRPGSLPSLCPEDKELSMMRCHRKCEEGKRGFGPFCWGKGFVPGVRGWGSSPSCKPEEYNNMGMCFKEHCSEKFPLEVGPLCLATACPAYAPVRCGRLCLADQAACTQAVINVASKGIEAAKDIKKEDYVEATGPAAQVLKWAVNYKQCPNIEDRP
ncbi:hypothetical protein HK102_009603, partial [Quaeritorhiza haematococci]